MPNRGNIRIQPSEGREECWYCGTPILALTEEEIILTTVNDTIVHIHYDDCWKVISHGISMFNIGLNQVLTGAEKGSTN